jgi:hypothetical protein
LFSYFLDGWEGCFEDGISASKMNFFFFQQILLTVLFSLFLGDFSILWIRGMGARSELLTR